MAAALRVLYVDDEPGLLEIGKLFLERGGTFAVDTLTSAGDALANIPQKQYDAIISDYQMPEIDGIAFLKAIRAAGNPIPFILFTGRGREEVVIQALNEGADFYLQKGGDPEAQFAELAHKIRQAIGKCHAETRIRDHERREADIINFLPDATFAIDTHGVVIAWNRAMETMTGVPATEILGTENYAYAVPFYHESRPILIDLVLKEDPATEARYPYITRSGDKLIAEITIPFLNNGAGSALWFTASPLYDTKGTIVGAIESIRDVTERKRIEEANRESEEKFRSLVENALESILIVDLQGTILFANNSLAKLVEVQEPLGLAGRNVMEFIAPESQEDVMKDFLEVARGHDAYLAQYTVLSEKGNKITVESIGKVISYEGRPADLVSLRDITKHRKAEEAVRQKNLMLTTLNDFQKEFAEVPSGSRVEDLVVKKLMGLSGAVVTMFSAYDPKDEVLRVSSITYDPGILSSLPGAIEMLTRWLGKRPEDMQMPLGQETYRDINRSVVGVKKTVAELSYGSISPLVSASIQKLSGIDHFIHIAHVIDGELYGISVMGLKAGQPDPSQALLESFAHIVAVSLRRQRVEAGIAESEELLRDIIEKNPMSIQIVDREGFTLNVNPAFIRLFSSVPPPDFSIITDLVKSHPELENLISQVKSGEAVNLPDMRFNPHDIYPELPDMPTRVRAIIFPINDRNGKPERFVFMHENITGQKLAEEALLGSRRILEAVIDNVPARVFWKDTNLTYFGCNTAFARDAGFDKPEYVIGKDDYAMGWRNQAELYRADDRHVIESGNAKLFIEEPQTTPTGKQISLLTSKVPLRNAAGDIIGVLGTYIDVTERKRAAEELKESEISYRGLFNTIQHALYILDREGKFVDVNTGAEKMYGYTREEFTGRTPEFLSAPGKNDLPAVVEKIQKAFAGEPQEFEFWGLRKNGEIFPKDVFLYRGTYFGEDIILAVGIDTTERMKAQELIRESEEKYRLLADNLPDYVFIHREGTLLYVNRAVVEVTGMTAAELTRHSVMDFIAPESKALVAERVRQRVLGEQSCRYEAAILVKNAKKLYGLVNSIQIPYNGSPASLVVVTDIDERKAAEQNLKESEERFRMLLQHVPSIAVQGYNMDGTTQYWNDAAEKLYGYTAEEALGKNILDLIISPEMKDEVRKTIEYMAETGQPIPASELSLMRKDGSRVEVFSHHALVNNYQRGWELFCIDIDLSERKKAEEALRQANRKLNLLSGITRHDINNQLTVLQGYLRILEKKYPDPSLNDYFVKVSNAAQRISSMIQFTREYEDIGVNAPEWQDCRTVVDTAAKDAPLGKVLVKNDLPVGAEVFADPLIVKVCYNLMDNAIRYGEKITTIRFSVQEFENDHLIICEDDGVGVPVEEKEKIFERGFGKNTGMGLFLSREILAITGITLRETGEPGKGARFEMTVPKEAWRTSGKRD